MNKIKKVSFLFRVIFQCSLVFVVAAQIIGWIYAPAFENVFSVIPKIYLGYVPNVLSADVRFMGFMVTFIPFTIEFLVMYYLVQLFKHFERHEIFTPDAVRCIRNAGYALFVSQLLTPIFDFILGFVLTSKNPPGLRYANLMFSDTNIKFMLTALIIILISWIMAEGCQLREEQQLTI